MGSVIVEGKILWHIISMFWLRTVNMWATRRTYVCWYYIYTHYPQTCPYLVNTLFMWHQRLYDSLQAESQTQKPPTSLHTQWSQVVTCKSATASKDDSLCKQAFDQHVKQITQTLCYLASEISEPHCWFAKRISADVEKLDHLFPVILDRTWKFWKSLWKNSRFFFQWNHQWPVSVLK